LQKIIWIALLLTGPATAKEEIVVPCRYELRVAHGQMARKEVGQARGQLIAALSRCRDLAGIQAGARLAAKLPPGPPQAPVVEVGLKANGALLKSDTGWFVRLKDPRGPLRVQLHYETMDHKLLDVQHGDEGAFKTCEIQESDMLTCYSSDFLKTLPLPGLYKVSITTAKGTQTHQIILSEGDFQFEVARLEAPSTAYQTFFTKKVHYVVEEPKEDPRLKAARPITEFEFSLLRTDSKMGEKPWTVYKFPAAEFKRRGSIEVPGLGDYRLQFTTRQVLPRGQVHFVLENTVGRRFEIN